MKGLKVISVSPCGGVFSRVGVSKININYNGKELEQSFVSADEDSEC